MKPWRELRSGPARSLPALLRWRARARNAPRPVEGGGSRETHEAAATLDPSAPSESSVGLGPAKELCLRGLEQARRGSLETQTQTRSGAAAVPDRSSRPGRPTVPPDRSSRPGRPTGPPELRLPAEGCPAEGRFGVAGSESLLTITTGRASADSTLLTSCGRVPGGVSRFDSDEKK